MRLFGKVDSVIDRYDRAEWLTIPFDLAFGGPVVVLPSFFVSMDMEVTQVVSLTSEVTLVASMQVEI